MANPSADILLQAARLNADDPRRRGNVVQVAPERDVIVTGDIHGNRDALAKVIRHADLRPSCSRRLILHEVIHGPLDPRSGHDRSIEVLLRAARLKIQCPEEVIFVLGNHDVAEVTGNEITRGGQPSCKTFAAGVEYAFRESAPEIMGALTQFIMSMPLAVRCMDNVMISHSLPGADRMSDACAEILDRPYTHGDLMRGQPVYEWVWGRKHTPEQIDQLAQRLGVGFFIIGHLHSSDGFGWLSPRAVTLASDHAKGCIMRFSSSDALDQESAQEAIKPIAALT